MWQAMVALQQKKQLKSSYVQAPIVNVNLDSYLLAR